jgi:hypothetical protein
MWKIFYPNGIFKLKNKNLLNLGVIYIVENEILLFVAKWMELEDQAEKYFVSTLV